MNSASKEDYLKAIFHLTSGENEKTSTKEISESLRVKPSSVSDMMLKLQSLGLISYKKYYGVSLTFEGKKEALHIIRKHRLWEYFMVEKLKLSWDEVHDIAEQLEHVKSKLLVDKLDAFLNYPSHDPHGDPIPSKEGFLSEIPSLKLIDCKEGETLKIVRVANDSKELLRYLDKNHLKIESLVEIAEIRSFEESISIKHESKFIQLPNKIATNILVKKQ